MILQDVFRFVLRFIGESEAIYLNEEVERIPCVDAHKLEGGPEALTI